MVKKRLITLILGGAIILSATNSATAAAPKSTRGMVCSISVYANSSVTSTGASSHTGSSGQPDINVSATYVKIHRATGDKKVASSSNTGSTIAAVYFKPGNSYVSWSISAVHTAKYKKEYWKGETADSLY